MQKLKLDTVHTTIYNIRHCFFDIIYRFPGKTYYHMSDHFDLSFFQCFYCQIIVG